MKYFTNKVEELVSGQKNLVSGQVLVNSDFKQLLKKYFWWVNYCKYW